MSVDAQALLRIRNLAAPPNELGIVPHVVHRGDASLVSTFTNFRSLTPDEFSLGLRKQLGAALDAHDDPRGILIFPDVCEPRARSYDAIVKEMAADGIWAPMVGPGHVPVRYTSAAAGTHDDLIGAMIAKMGRDAALAFDMLAQVNAIGEIATASPDAAEESAAHLKTLVAPMGAAFAQRYAESLRRKMEAEHQRHQAHVASMNELTALFRTKS